MAAQWYYARGKEAKFGPFTADELKRLAASGELRPDDKVWKEGKRKWVSARKVERLFDAAPAPATAGHSHAKGDSVAAAGAPVTNGLGAGGRTPPEVSGRSAVEDRVLAAAPSPIVLSAAARFERVWLDWRARHGRRAQNPAQALAFVAESNDRMELADQLLVANATVPAGASPLLSDIAGTLLQLGFTHEGAVEWFAGQEKVHADYYDSLRRQKRLKELLAQIARFQEMTDSLYDVFARAYGARRLIATLERHRFSARALADSADKDLLNRQISWAADACAKLPPQSLADMANFEKAYTLYHWLEQADPEAELRAQKCEPPGLVKLGVNAPAVPAWGLGTFWILFAVTLFWSSLLLLVCILSVAQRDPPPGGYVNFVCFLDAFPVTVTLSVFLVARRRYRRALAQYRAERVSYQQTLARVTKASRELRSHVLAHNDAIDKQLPGIRQAHQESVSSLRSLINDFLSLHPQLSTFVSAV